MWNNLNVDVNDVLGARNEATATIRMNRMEEISTSAFHLRMAVARFKYRELIFIVVKSLIKILNRSGTCGVSD
jgi:hypothetical protein